MKRDDNDSLILEGRLETPMLICAQHFLQAEIYCDTPARYPRIAREFGENPLFNLRAGPGIKHDV